MSEEDKAKKEVKVKVLTAKQQVEEDKRLAREARRAGNKWFKVWFQENYLAYIYILLRFPVDKLYETTVTCVKMAEILTELGRKETGDPTLVLTKTHYDQVRTAHRFNKYKQNKKDYKTSSNSSKLINYVIDHEDLKTEHARLTEELKDLKAQNGPVEYSAEQIAELEAAEKGQVAAEEKLEAKTAEVEELKKKLSLRLVEPARASDTNRKEVEDKFLLVKSQLDYVMAKYNINPVMLAKQMSDSTEITVQRIKTERLTPEEEEEARKESGEAV